tara:strand:+ start:608 stop:1114 length:507 start_codon:yes stop_codon:yes gene_type:complete
MILSDNSLLTMMRITKIFVFLAASVFIGYSVMNIDPDILERMTDVKYQFIAIVALTASFYDYSFKTPRKDLLEILAISILFTIMLHLISIRYAIQDEKVNEAPELDDLIKEGKGELNPFKGEEGMENMEGDGEVEGVDGVEGEVDDEDEDENQQQPAAEGFSGLGASF